MIATDESTYATHPSEVCTANRVIMAAAQLS